MDLDAEESVAERVARLLTHQAGATMSCRASSSPENRKMIRQSPRLSAKSHQSAGSDMRSGSLPVKPKLTFVDAVGADRLLRRRRPRPWHESELRHESDETRNKAQRGERLGRRAILSCDLPLMI